ncbi:MAG: hypothetical protein OXH09_10615 [Gammaproteobacteria bacterium]|nr:hypothetical protein [Gammaproteobacteria bacterium]
MLTMLTLLETLTILSGTTVYADGKMARIGGGVALLANIVAYVVLTGCDNFEHALTWDDSPAADGLVGSWRAVEGDDTGTVAEVSPTDDGALRIHLKHANGNSKAKFVADLLATESVHVLQIRMKTYEGKDATRRGFRFRRATFAGNELILQQPDVHMLGRLAEEAYTDAGVQMKAETIAGCLGDDMTNSLLGLFWGYLAEDLDDDLRAKVLTGLSNEPPAEAEAELAQLADLEVDPYKVLSQLRPCIARHLPSELLGELFRLYADLVFGGKVDRYARDDQVTVNSILPKSP